MLTDLRKILQKYRSGASSEYEKGIYFERLVKVWLESAPTQRDQFVRVLTFGAWAKENGLKQQDTGIDLVAQMAGSSNDWCAVQCKFYRHGYRIQKPDIDSFFTASGKRPFIRRIIVDTTDAPWSEHADAALKDQIVETTRVGLSDLEDSGIDWAFYSRDNVVRLLEKKQPRPHQVEAVAAVREGMTKADRGKLIMACGTGKTFTALKIAEMIAGQGGRVLYLVPSLSLMSQTIREWSIDCSVPLRSFAVCSDEQVGVRRAKDGDLADIDIHDLEIPATTHAAKLAAKAQTADPNRMTVVFSTYQSIQVVADAQSTFSLADFDLIVCDEAHRTTGVTLSGEDESNFVRVHDAIYLRGIKRLYMTATPRIFGEAVKKTAQDADAALCSMDDAILFGETFFTRNFSWAVQNGLLTDYKVIVLAVDEAAVSAGLQKRLSDENSELVLDDATKIVGCFKALTKADFKPDVASDTGPMHRALAFARDIKRSKLIEAEFARVAADWRASLEPEVAEAIPPLVCEVKHVDGEFSAHARNERLAWLKAGTDNADTCRILTNARCLSEGVDVPALDAILFLHPRKSQIDVVQAVGRVMRRAEGKRMGYVILPVGVPAGMTPEEALDDNEKYKVVWQILNALRAHDDRLDATINKIDLGVNPGDRIEIIAVTNTLPSHGKTLATSLDLGAGGGATEGEPGNDFPARSVVAGAQMMFQFDGFAKAIMARIVKKCGTRTYWEDWAKDVARVADVHVTRIKAVVEAAKTEERAAFETFLSEIRDDLNDSITSDEAIEMLAQHLITRPVFEALFEGYSFAANNPVSRALEGVLDVLDRQGLGKEAQSLERFYASVRMRAAGVEDATGKQRIVVELYDKFFRTAFPRLAQRLGIVYTPVEIVDFIIKSVDELLRNEFGETLGSQGVHVIDPFVGTGTFITRLLHSGLMTREQTMQKYQNEIHANEIVLLAYYIAAINIEAAYHEISGGEYDAFPGICLTDTFQLYEKDDLVSGMMAENSSRRTRQKRAPIKVIFGNPPYSAGQSDANANNKNIEYPSLDGRIENTYAARSAATLKNKLYDSYIRAIRWGSDRLPEAGGILAFVSGSAWLERPFADGMRKCVAEEFSSVHVVRLRGDIRKNMMSQGRAREGENVFGQASMTGIAITLFVNNPAASQRGRIVVHDIGDDLSRLEKLDRLVHFGGLAGIAQSGGWQSVLPNEYGDWISQRDVRFDKFLAIADKGSTEPTKVFANFSLGLVTNRDAWCINASKTAMLANMSVMIANYKDEVARFAATEPQFKTAKARDAYVDGFVTEDAKRISWTRGLKSMLGRKQNVIFDADKATLTSYRPFQRQWLYFDRKMNEMVLQIPRIFPAAGVENRVISIAGVGARSGFSVLMLDAIPNLDTIEKGQCFPRYLYEATRPGGELFGASGTEEPSYHRTDAITDEAVSHFEVAYPGEKITKDDLFHYVYGLLHSEDYRDRYADNLTKQLPRIPLTKQASDFRAFVEAGRALSDLHVGYETVEPYPVTIKEGDLRLADISDPIAYFRVEKMKFVGGRGGGDKSIVIYNPRITITNIPLETYDYIVNGKPALEWVIDRQSVKTDAASCISNDANCYANETVGDPAYPFKLFCRIITVSLETMKIVRSLPALDVLEAA
jgi:predicted helicase